MSIPLRISPEEIRSIAGDLGHLSEEASHVNQSLNRSWHRLDSGWESYARSDINGQFAHIMHDVGRMAAMLEQMAMALNKAAELTENADSAAVQAFSQLAIANKQQPSIDPSLLNRLLHGGTLTPDEIRVLLAQLAGQDGAGEETTRLTMPMEVYIPFLEGVAGITFGGEVILAITRLENGHYQLEISPMIDAGVKGEVAKDTDIYGTKGATTSISFDIDPNNNADLAKLQGLLKTRPDPKALLGLVNENLHEIKLGGKDAGGASVLGLGGSGETGSSLVVRHEGGKFLVGQEQSIQLSGEGSLLFVRGDVNANATLLSGRRVNNVMDTINPFAPGDNVTELKLEIAGRPGIGLDTSILPYPVGAQATVDGIGKIAYNFKFTNMQDVNPVTIAQHLQASDWNWFKQHSQITAEATSGIGATANADLLVVNGGIQVDREVTTTVIDTANL